jgi:hypothetical protein
MRALRFRWNNKNTVAVGLYSLGAFTPSLVYAPSHDSSWLPVNLDTQWT